MATKLEATPTPSITRTNNERLGFVPGVTNLALDVADRGQSTVISVLQDVRGELRTFVENGIELAEKTASQVFRFARTLTKRVDDAAAETLSRLLNPETPGYHAAVRKKVLYDAWDLALRLHPKLVDRLGFAELNKPGRRIEAIAAVERKLAAEPNNSTAKEYRTLLYAQLNEGEFTAAAAGGTPKEFNYEYVEQLGLALVEDADPDRRERGMGYLRVAGRGLAERAPGLYTKLAQTYEKHGDPENATRALEAVKQVGLSIGAANLPKDQRQFYLDALRKLAVAAEARGDIPHAAAEEARERGDLAAGPPAARHEDAEEDLVEPSAEVRADLKPPLEPERALDGILNEVVRGDVRAGEVEGAAIEVGAKLGERVARGPGRDGLADRRRDADDGGAGDRARGAVHVDVRALSERPCPPDCCFATMRT